jgi:S1-C subfamily serine protease
MNRNILAAALLISFAAGALSGGAAGVFAPYAVSQGWLEPLISANSQTAAGADVKDPADLEDIRVTNIVESALPSVVSINITKEITREDLRFDGMEEFFNDPFFAFPLPEQLPEREETRERFQVGGGTGFFVSADGMIATNRHVINDEEAEYTVVTQDGREFIAKVVAVDTVLDIGFLQIEGEDGEEFPALVFGNSDEIEVGETVIAIGNALAEFRNTVTKGIVSGINRRIVAGNFARSEVIEEAIQTDAAINPGNSGGPLINLRGEVVGINTAVTDGAQSLGFALPSNALLRALESVREHGRIIRPWIGVRYIPIDREYAKQNDLAYHYGAHVVQGNMEAPAIIPDSPAERAGIKSGDIILEIDGQKIDIEHSLSLLISKKSPDDIVTLKIARDGEEADIRLTLDERDASF